MQVVRLTDGRFAALLRPLLRSSLPLLFIIATVIAERNSGWMDARIVGRAAAELAQIFFCAAKCQIWPTPAIDMDMIWIGHDS